MRKELRRLRSRMEIDEENILSHCHRSTVIVCRKMREERRRLR